MGTIIKTTDSGITWLPDTSPVFNILNSVFFLTINTAYAVGANGTILKYSGTTNISEGPFSRPVDFIMNQNYPNPFNPSTTIGFVIPRASDVQLEVFNMLGQKVATLVSEMFQAGEHKVRWDAAGLSSGIYFYRLKAGSFSYSKKLILLR